MVKPLAVFAIRQVSRTTGAVRNLLEQAGYIQILGYDIHICAERADHARLIEHGFRWIHIPRFPIKGYIHRLFFDWYVQRHIRRVKPDLFISHGDACSNDILVIHNCNALFYECLYGSEFKKTAEVSFQNRVIRKSRFRYLIANSELMKRDLTQRYDLDPSKVGVFYQGVDTSVFNPRNHSERRQKGRSMLQVPNQTYLVGLITSGAFGKRNVCFFLELAAKVRINFPEARFVVAGKDSKVQWYKKYASQLGLEYSVVFAPPVASVELYYHALDLFVFPAKMEEYGRVVLEALACGIPAIIGASVGASEIMLHESVPTILYGWDATQWADEIVSFAKNPAKAKAHADAGLKLAEKYSQSDRARKMEELLFQLIRA